MENIILPESHESNTNDNTNLVNELEKSTNVAYTANGAISNRTSLDAVLDFFASAGAMRYSEGGKIFDLFHKAFVQDNLLALKCLFYFRDIRGGQGERKAFRVIFKQLGHLHPEKVNRNLENVVKYGRWDDLFCLENTKAWFQASKFIQKQFETDVVNENTGLHSVSLLAKWLPSVNASSQITKNRGKYFAKFFGMQQSEYRKTLSKLRTAIDVLEKKMTTKQWSEIDYQKVPSVAGLKYRGAFSRNDEKRYVKYLEDVAKGKKKINASTLYPYDIVSKLLEGCGMKRVGEQEVQALLMQCGIIFPTILRINLIVVWLCVIQVEVCMVDTEVYHLLMYLFLWQFILLNEMMIQLLEMRFLHFLHIHNFKELLKAIFLKRFLLFHVQIGDTTQTFKQFLMLFLKLPKTRISETTIFLRKFISLVICSLIVRVKMMKTQITPPLKRSLKQKVSNVQNLSFGMSTQMVVSYL